MKTHLRASLSFLLVGFILGFFTSFLIFAHTKSSTSKSAVVQKAKELKKSADTIDVAYQNQIEMLQDQNIELQQQLEVSQGLLTQAKQETQEKENNLNKLLLQRSILSTKNLFQKNNSPRPFKTYLTPKQQEILNGDGIALFSDSKESKPFFCDSLEKEVQEYIEANHRKDIAYELQLISFDSVLSNKDQIIEASQKAYDDLKALLDNSLLNQTALQKENRLLRSRNSRQRFQSKIVTAACMVLSGIAASMFIHH
jgi:hypothetical protein